jgi:hypothetical protein
LPENYKDYGVIYEILLIKDSASGGEGAAAAGLTAAMAADDEDGPGGRWSLPTTKTMPNQDPADVVLRAWPHVRPKRAELADAVPLKYSGAIGGATSLLYFAPVSRALDVKSSEDGSFANASAQWPGSNWAPLSMVLESLRPLRDAAFKLGPDTASLVAALEGWLCETHFLPQTVVTLWNSAARHRLQEVVRNPSSKGGGKGKALKAPKTVVNPLHGAGLVLFPPGSQIGDSAQVGDFSDDYNVGEGQAVAAAKLRRTQSYGPGMDRLVELSVESHLKDEPNWAGRFPLHKAAVIGDTDRVAQLIREGLQAAVKDEDLWTPLHYAAWHGQVDVVNILLRDWQGGPIEVTDNGSTALHYAARNGYPKVVQLLLACPIVKADAVDNEKNTPLMLCETLKQGQHAEVARILKDPRAQNAVNRYFDVGNTSTAEQVQFTDFRIYLLDNSIKVIRLPDKIDAQHLRDGVAGMLQIPEEAFALFAIWIVSPSLQIQLSGEMEPFNVIRQWSSKLELHTSEDRWSEDSSKVLIFKRHQLASLRTERQTRSPVSMTFLFYEAQTCYLNSYWPCSVDDSVFLAGMLMQIRFGDHNPTTHKTGFLADDLDTFVPAHLMHNQLKSGQWEAKIFKSHQDHAGKTDLQLLHRLFLQYCWQWPFYGATFFEAELPRGRKGRNEAIRIGFTTDWCTIISGDTNQLKVQVMLDQLTHTYSPTEPGMLNIKCADPQTLAGLRPVRGAGSSSDTLEVATLQASLIDKLLIQMQQQAKDAKEEILRKRRAQDGPMQMAHVSEAPQDRIKDEEEIRAYRARFATELNVRHKLTDTFGAPVRNEERPHAQVVLESRSTSASGKGSVLMSELKNVFMEFGYWLGPDLEAARMFLSANGGVTFTFRDVVSWWAQSLGCNWLFLLDDAAFKQRHVATEIFLRNDPQRLGKVQGEKLMGVIRGLRSANLTKKTEEVCLEGLDPNDMGYVLLNDYIAWLCQMRIIYDRKLVG